MKPTKIAYLTDFQQYKNKNLWTNAFAIALETLEKAGGGRLIVPPGTYETGSITLISNLEFLVEEGATIVGSPNLKEYEKHEWGHNIDRTPWHLIFGKKCTNLTLSGKGVINGSGPAFWETDPSSSDHQDGGFIKAYKERRPSPMVELVDCSDLRVKNLTLTNSPGWTIHLHDCTDVVVQGIRVRNSYWAPNSDGIDITGSQKVRIIDCDIQTGDDGICIKTTGDSREAKDIRVDNCRVRSYCAALKLGCVESVKDMSDIHFTNCRVEESSRIIAIYSYRGAQIENVSFTHITGNTKTPLIQTRPIYIEARLDQPSDDQPDAFFYDIALRKPHIRDIHITDFVCQTEGRVMIVAGDGLEVSGIQLKKVHLTYPWIYRAAQTGESFKSRQFPRFPSKARTAQAAFVLENLQSISFDDVKVQWPQPQNSEALVLPPKGWDFPKRFENGSWDTHVASPEDCTSSSKLFWFEQCGTVEVTTVMEEYIEFV